MNNILHSTPVFYHTRFENAELHLQKGIINFCDYLEFNAFRYTIISIEQVAFACELATKEFFRKAPFLLEYFKINIDYARFADILKVVEQLTDDIPEFLPNNRAIIDLWWLRDRRNEIIHDKIQLKVDDVEEKLPNLILIVLYLLTTSHSSLRTEMADYFRAFFATERRHLLSNHEIFRKLFRTVLSRLSSNRERDIWKCVRCQLPSFDMQWGKCWLCETEIRTFECNGISPHWLPLEERSLSTREYGDLCSKCAMYFGKRDESASKKDIRRGIMRWCTNCGNRTFDITKGECRFCPNTIPTFECTGQYNRCSGWLSSGSHRIHFVDEFPYCDNCYSIQFCANCDSFRPRCTLFHLGCGQFICSCTSSNPGTLYCEYHLDLLNPSMKPSTGRINRGKTESQLV